MNPRILFIDDDINFAESVLQLLELRGVVCDFCSDGKQGLNLLKKSHYDVIVSDVNMPNMDGISMCQTLRKEGYDIPLILITANSELNDKLDGFDSGADDYLTKPFESMELLARIKSLAKRRSLKAKTLKIEELGLELHLDKHLIYRDGTELDLSPSSWIIIEELAKAFPNPVSKKNLMYSVWGDELPDNNLLKVHIHRLRARLDKPFKNSLLQVVKGFGFQLRK